MLLKIYLQQYLSLFPYSVNYHRKHMHIVWKLLEHFFNFRLFSHSTKTKLSPFSFISFLAKAGALLPRQGFHVANKSWYFFPQEFLASFASADSHSPHARCFAKSFTEVTRVFEYSHKRMKRMYVGGSKRLICEKEISMSGIV